LSPHQRIVLGERVVLATGHPTGLIELYAEIGRLIRRLGCQLLRPADGARWEEPDHRRAVGGDV